MKCKECGREVYTNDMKLEYCSDCKYKVPNSQVTLDGKKVSK